MKIKALTLVLVLLFIAGCGRKAETDRSKMMQKDPHAGLEMDRMKGMMKENPYDKTEMEGGLDLDAMLSKLPAGWTQTKPMSSMRLAQISLAGSGANNPAEIAIFHFPGTGGSASANIQRWQSQFQGPKGEPGTQIAKTDTMMVGLLTVVTTDVTGTYLAQGGMMGPDEDQPDSRMIASVIETPSGNWFIKAVGPTKTIAEHEKRIRDFVRTAKVKEPKAS